MTDEPTSAADFEITGPDDNGHAWLEHPNAALNLGPWEDAAEKFCTWLGAVEYEPRT
jgi:hypothetical protein